MSLAFDQDAERRLVESVVRGEQEAVVVFEKRVRCVSGFLGALNARRGRPLDEHDLADLAQDTIMIAWRKLADYRPLAPLEVWLHRLCCYEFANALRRRGRQRRRHPNGLELDGMPAASQATNVHDDIHLALERLGGIEAEIIQLKHFSGLTFVEIAARMATPENTVKTRYYRGMARLQQMLQKSGGAGEDEP